MENEAENGTYTRLDLQRACRTLEINNPERVDEDALQAVFQIRCTEAPAMRDVFQHALKVIQRYRADHSMGDAGGQMPSQRRGMSLLEFI